MKTIASITVLFIAAIMASPVLAGEPPAKKEWQIVIGTNTGSTTYSVRQLVADGSGGCSLIYRKAENGTNYHHVLRLDKKGKELWHTSIIEPNAVSITYADSKITVVSYSPSVGNSYIMTFDTKNNQTTTSETNVDVYNDVNAALDTPGDKKGFFAVRFNNVTLETAISRHSYKPEKEI